MKIGKHTVWPKRTARLCSAIAVALLLAAVIPRLVMAADLGTWSTTGIMSTARIYHTATLLPNGKVLAAGGQNGVGSGKINLSSAELYDPSTGSWSSTGSMNNARRQHTATLLPNGEVLVAGGGGGSLMSLAELYDPAAGTWSTTGSMSAGRANFTATLLPNGEVLVAGGTNGSSYPSSAELYDPAAGTWSTTGSMSVGRANCTATLLPSGNVLVAGGSSGGNTSSSAELYDPAAGTWSTTGSMSVGRANCTATLLPSGNVLVAGGSSGGYTSSSAEVYDPSARTWSLTGSMSANHISDTATLLPNGKVLVAGEYNHVPSPSELYDPGGAIPPHIGIVTATVAGGAVPTGSLNEYNLYVKITSTADSRFAVGQLVWCAARTTDFPTLLTLGSGFTGMLDNSSGWWVMKAYAPSPPPITVSITATVASVAVPTGAANQYSLYIKINGTGEMVWCAGTTTDFPQLRTLGASVVGILSNSSGWWVLKAAMPPIPIVTATVASVPIPTGAANQYNLNIKVVGTGEMVWCAATTTDFPQLLTFGAAVTGTLDNSSGWWVLRR
jgi:hypothetical protein